VAVGEGVLSLPPRSHTFLPTAELVFGCQDGKLRVGQLRSNKTATLFNSDSYVVSCAPSPDGNAVLSGHADGSIYRFTFEDGAGTPSSQVGLTRKSGLGNLESWSGYFA
jgi:WD40 repeat protein